MNTIIFDCEFKFRQYLIKYSKNINNMVILEDKLDSVIFFYSFTDDNLILASRESSLKSFEYYNKIYRKLTKKLGLDIEYNTTNPKVLKLTKK